MRLLSWDISSHLLRFVIDWISIALISCDSSLGSLIEGCDWSWSEINWIALNVNNLKFWEGTISQLWPWRELFVEINKHSKTGIAKPLKWLQISIKLRILRESPGSSIFTWGIAVILVSSFLTSLASNMQTSTASWPMQPWYIVSAWRYLGKKDCISRIWCPQFAVSPFLFPYCA